MYVCVCVCVSSMIAAWSRRHPEVDLWMLKNNKQRGTGLRLVRTRDAFKACFETTYRPGLEGMKLYRCAQRRALYVTMVRIHSNSLALCTREFHL